MMWKQTIAAVVGMLMLAGQAWAVRIDALARLKGDQPNELVGVGLVVGLNGTGDGGDFEPAMRALQNMLGRLNNHVALTRELKNAKNVAIVTISVSVPPAGAHTGDKVDVKVSAIAAKSLKGGRLFLTPLRGPDPEATDERGGAPIFAFASGDLQIEDDATPTQAVIRAGRTGGAVLTADFAPWNISEDGRFTLVVNPNKAGFATATAIADQINEEVSPQTDGKSVATAIDATTVEVQIPRAELDKPAQFISRVMQLPVPKLPGTAKVTINQKTKTIVFSGDVELSPTLISQKGLTINIGAAGAAVAGAGSFVALDPHKQGSPKLKDLMDAFNVLKVGPEDRIAIIKALHESGALDAQLQLD